MPAQIGYHFAQFCKVRATMKRFPEIVHRLLAIAFQLRLFAGKLPSSSAIRRECEELVGCFFSNLQMSLSKRVPHVDIAGIGGLVSAGVLQCLRRLQVKPPL